jgi:hypothetical protein
MAGKSKVISLTNNKAAALYQHSVELTFGPDDLTWVQFDGSRIKFTQSGVQLDHWVEHYDATNQYATIWIRVPVFATGTSYIEMQYGSGVMGYVAKTAVPEILRPAATGNADARSLPTWPLRSDSSNLVCVHPSVIAAEGWTRFSTPGVQDVTLVQCNTPWDATDLPTGWAVGSVELPELWVYKGGSWQWPTGTASWRQTDATSDDRLVNGINRFNPTIMPIPTNCNAIVGPVCTKAAPTTNITTWSDPHVVWIASSSTLRVYFRLNTETFPLYYLDITSTNGAWSGSVLGAPAICTTTGGDFILANALESGYDEYLSPSVIFDGTYFWLFALEYITATRLTILSRWRSSDGIAWTKQTAPVVHVPTGLHGVGWHMGVFIAETTWYMFTSAYMSVTDTYTIAPKMALMWQSIDAGVTWDLCTPQLAPYYDGYVGSLAGTRSPYRPAGCYAPGVGLVTCIGFNSATGTQTSIDPTWSPRSRRQVPAIAKVFWRGAWSGEEMTALTEAANADGFIGDVIPYGVQLTKTNACSPAVSGSEFQWTQSANSTALMPLIDCPESYHLRLRYRALAASTTRFCLNIGTYGLWDARDATATKAYPVFRNSSSEATGDALAGIDTGRATDVARTVDLRITRNDTVNAGYLSFLDRAATNSNTKVAAAANPFEVLRASNADVIAAGCGDAYNRWVCPVCINDGTGRRGLAFTFAFLREGLTPAEETTMTILTESDITGQGSSSRFIEL